MKRLILLVASLVSMSLHAQSIPSMARPVTLAGPLGLNAAMAQKADASNGVFSNPSITGGSVVSTDTSASIATTELATAARTMSSRFQDSMSASDFGAKCDGVSNDTQSFQSAIEALGKRGGRIIIPATGSSCRVSGLRIDQNNITLDGLSYTANTQGGAKIEAYDSTSDVIAVSGGGDFIRNVLITSAGQQTSGSLVSFIGASIGGIDHVQFSGGYNAISLTGSDGALWFDKIQIRNFSHDAVFIDTTGQDTYFNNIQADEDDASLNPNAGFEIQNHGGTFVLTNSDIIHSHNGLLVDPGLNQFAIWGYLSNVFFDTSDFGTPRGTGISLMPTDGGIVNGWKFSDVWVATAAVGLKIVSDGGSSVQGISFSQLKSINNQESGVQIAWATDVNFTSPEIVSNSVEASGTYPGVDIFNGSTGIKFIGGHIGGSVYGFTNLHSYGIQLESGFNGTISVIGTDLSGYKDGTINNLGSPGVGSEVSSSPGFNPQGTATITPSSSPYTYTAGLSKESVNVFGGDVSSITVNGVTMAASTGVSFMLAPLQSVVITYSSAPTLSFNKM